MGILMAASVVLSTTSSALSEKSEHVLTTAPVFAGIPWGTDVESVKSQMISKGYKFDIENTSKDTDHDLWFTGLVQNTDSQIFEHIDQNRHLVATTIRILTPDDDCKSTFDSIVFGITQKYGVPSSQKENFQAPYTGAPSDFIPAIKQDKANFDITWTQAGDDVPGVEVEVENDLDVLIYYRGPQWEAERRRRISISKLDSNL
jgi:hypothetical protein